MKQKLKIILPVKVNDKITNFNKHSHLPENLQVRIQNLQKSTSTKNIELISILSSDSIEKRMIKKVKVRQMALLQQFFNLSKLQMKFYRFFCENKYALPPLFSIHFCIEMTLNLIPSCKCVDIPFFCIDIFNFKFQCCTIFITCIMSKSSQNTLFSGLQEMKEIRQISQMTVKDHFYPPNVYRI